MALIMKVVKCSNARLRALLKAPPIEAARLIHKGHPSDQQSSFASRNYFADLKDDSILFPCSGTTEAVP
jgi:hypothetical protein